MSAYCQFLGAVCEYGNRPQLCAKQSGAKCGERKQAVEIPETPPGAGALHGLLDPCCGGTN